MRRKHLTRRTGHRHPRDAHDAMESAHINGIDIERLLTRWPSHPTIPIIKEGRAASDATNGSRKPTSTGARKSVVQAAAASSADVRGFRGWVPLRSSTRQRTKVRLQSAASIANSFPLRTVIRAI